MADLINDGFKLGAPAGKTTLDFADLPTDPAGCGHDSSQEDAEEPKMIRIWDEDTQRYI